MNVYQVVFEKCDKDGAITDISECVEAKTLITVATAMNERAEQMEWDLKSIRYICTVVERIEI